MSANTSPIWTLIGDIQWASSISAANTAKDGTGTVATVFTADATNGGYLAELRFKPQGTNTASVARIFLNNGSTNATAANNVFFADVTLPTTTNSEVAGQGEFAVPMHIAMPPGYKVNVTLGTAVAAGWAVTAIGGKY